MQTPVNYLFLIPLLPLLGALINGLWGQKLLLKFGPRGVHNLAILLPTLSFCLTCYAFLTLNHLPVNARVLTQDLFTFIAVDTLEVHMSLWFDQLSSVLTLIITAVGTLIHIYATAYMQGDPAYPRFFSYLNLFMTAMLLLVLGDNFLVLFIGWEGVGLCSYLLISFWYQEKANAQAGMKAFVVNRIGDFGLLLAMALIFWHLPAQQLPPANNNTPEHTVVTTLEVPESANSQTPAETTILLPETSSTSLATATPQLSLNFATIKQQILDKPELWHEAHAHTPKLMGLPVILLICLLLFLSTTGKSAQIPLYVWLPDAMAGPTPVSALIHAATMVTAGIYLIARLNFLFALSPTAMTIVALIGGLTALLAASIGLFQHDLKKVLAYSTVSQLGFMVIGVGVGAFSAGVYHLLTHALFKACLFLSAGSVILACHHEQDMRKMGGLKKYLPKTHLAYLISCLSISAAPIFCLANGFFSKDEILFKAFSAQHLLLPGYVFWSLGFSAAGLTSFYMWRSYYLTFSGDYQGATKATSPGHEVTSPPHESPKAITTVLMILVGLMFLSITLGFWPLLGITPLFEHYLAPIFSWPTTAGLLKWLEPTAATHHLELLLALASILLALIGFFSARLLYKDRKSALPHKLSTSHSIFIYAPYSLIHNKYFIDELYSFLVVKPLLKFSTYLAKFGEQSIDKLVSLTALISKKIALLDNLIDIYLVDGLVNLLAEQTLQLGAAIRKTETGRIQTYVLGALVGILGCIITLLLLS